MLLTKHEILLPRNHEIEYQRELALVSLQTALPGYTNLAGVLFCNTHVTEAKKGAVFFFFLGMSSTLTKTFVLLRFFFSLNPAHVFPSDDTALAFLRPEDFPLCLELYNDS